MKLIDSGQCGCDLIDDEKGGHKIERCPLHRNALDVLMAAEQAFVLLVGMIENSKVHPHEVRNTMQRLDKAISVSRDFPVSEKLPATTPDRSEHGADCVCADGITSACRTITPKENV